MLNFIQDIEKGRVGEDIFRKEFLDFLKVKYKDVTNCQAYQIIDSDFLSDIGLIEVKSNYKDNNQLIIETYTNCNLSLGAKSWGWVYKSKADLIVFISVKTHTMVFLPFNDKFKRHWTVIKGQTVAKRNNITEHNGKLWQSSFRIVPFNLLDGYISIYQKL